MQFKQRRVQRTSYCRGRRNECKDYENGFFFKLENLQDLLTQTGQENKQLKSDIKRIEFKENMVEKLQKAEGANKGLTKYINDMRAVINIPAPSLGEEGTKNMSKTTFKCN